MKTRKILFCTILFLTAFSSLNAITLEQITSGLAEHKVTEGDFTQIKTITMSKGTRDITSNGTFILSTQGVMWNTVKPLPSKLIVTETKLVQIDAKNNQSMLDGSENATFTSISSTIVSLFSNDLSVLKDKFALSFTEKDAQTWNLELTPKDSSIASVISMLILEGTCKNSVCTLDSLAMIEKTGGKITYLFANQTYSEAITDPLMLSFIE